MRLSLSLSSGLTKSRKSWSRERSSRLEIKPVENVATRQSPEMVAGSTHGQRKSVFSLSIQSGSTFRMSLLSAIASFFQIHPLAQPQDPYQKTSA